MPHRDLNITWQPISLLEKNQPAPDSDYFAPVQFTHNLLRVMESVRAAEGDDAAFRAYWEFATRIHHDGFDQSHAAAFDDASWDDVIRPKMQAGLALTGDDVGTPIIAMDDDNGDRVALFGPVISKVPSSEQSLRMWDSFVAMAQTPGFWELKRTRTEGPQFGERPA